MTSPPYCPYSDEENDESASSSDMGEKDLTFGFGEGEEELNNCFDWMNYSTSS